MDKAQPRTTKHGSADLDADAAKLESMGLDPGITLADLADEDACPNCGGLGIVAGCFEDTCSGADCDPEDAEFCCAPMRCDWCKGKSK